MSDTYWFDFDGTIAITDEKNYKDAKPNKRIIDLINRLYDEGDTIIVYTSRGSTRKINYVPLTQRQLKRWGVKYHHFQSTGPKTKIIDDDAIHPKDLLTDCRLCLAMQLEQKNILRKGEDWVILPTKTMKGHKKRVMIISKDHRPQEGFQFDNSYKEAFIEFCKYYFDEPTFALCEPTYCTISDHWHLIACDWLGTPEEREQLHYTPHRAFQTVHKFKPKRKK